MYGNNNQKKKKVLEQCEDDANEPGQRLIIPVNLLPLRSLFLK